MDTQFDCFHNPYPNTLSLDSLPLVIPGVPFPQTISGELLLFGGEYYDGEETTVYNGSSDTPVMSWMCLIGTRNRRDDHALTIHYVLRRDQASSAGTWSAVRVVDRVIGCALIDGFSCGGTPVHVWSDGMCTDAADMWLSRGDSHLLFPLPYTTRLRSGEWRQVESINTPPPRCSHQVRQQQNHSCSMLRYIFTSPLRLTTPSTRPHLYLNPPPHAT